MHINKVFLYWYRYLCQRLQWSLWRLDGGGQMVVSGKFYTDHFYGNQIRSDQSLSRVRLFATP